MTFPGRAMHARTSPPGDGLRFMRRAAHFLQSARRFSKGHPFVPFPRTSYSSGTSSSCEPREPPHSSSHITTITGATRTMTNGSTGPTCISSRRRRGRSLVSRRRSAVHNRVDSPVGSDRTCDHRAAVRVPDRGLQACAGRKPERAVSECGPRESGSSASRTQWSTAAGSQP